MKVFVRPLLLTLALTLALWACDGSTNQNSADGDQEQEAEQENVVACEETPWTIPTGTWQPASPYTDTAYRQEQSIMVTGLPAGPVPGVALSPWDTVYAAASDGVYRVYIDGYTAKVEEIPAASYTGLCAFSAADGSGRLAAVAGDTLVVVSNGDPLTVITTARSEAIVLARPGAPHGLWLVLDSGNMVKVDEQGQDLAIIPASPGLAIFDLAETTENHVLLAAATGLYEVDVSMNVPQPALVLDQAGGLPSDKVTGLWQEAEGTLWLATDAGLAAWKDGQVTVYTGGQGMPYLQTTGLAASADGTTLLILSDKGLMTYVPATDTWDYYHSRYWMPHWTTHGAVTDSRGYLFIATQEGMSVVMPMDMTLAQKAAVIDEGMYTRHNRWGMFSGCGLDVPGDLTTARTRDDDNDGEWTALYLASQCFRYLATGSQEARERAREAANAMLLLITVPGLPGFMARSVDEPGTCDAHNAGGGEWHVSQDGQYCWKGDTSSDEYVGHVFGISIYYDLVADETEKAHIAQVFGSFQRGLAENGFMLLDVDGLVTTHGHFDPYFINGMGRFGDCGLNGAMVLGGMKAAYHMTGDQYFLDQFNYLAHDEGYKEYIKEIQMYNTRSHINHDTEEMSFLALATLVRLEEDPCLMGYWQKGLKDLWESQRVERDPEFNMIYAWLSRAEENDVAQSVRTLKEMYLHGITWTVINSHRADYTLDPALDRFDKEQSLEVLPYDQKQAIRWAENPFRLDWEGSGTYERMLSPWLLPYWMGRYLGLITQ